MNQYISNKLIDKTKEYFDKHEGKDNKEQSKCKEEIYILIDVLNTYIELSKLPVVYKYKEEE